MRKGRFALSVGRMIMSKFKDQLIANLKHYDIDTDRVLSIGAQEEDKRYFKSFRCQEFLTLDASQDFRPDIRWDMNRSMTQDDVSVIDRFGEYFDLVLALNLWEYIYDPVVAHENIFNLLKPGGTLITNYPFVYPLHKPERMDYLRYTPEGAERLLMKAGFNVVTHDYIYGNDKLVGFYLNDGLKARAGFDHLVIGSIIKAKK